MQVFLTEKHIGIAMEYASGGDLFDYTVKRGGLKEDEARWFFQQLICAVDYMHTKVRGSPPSPPLPSHTMPRQPCPEAMGWKLLAIR